MRSSADLKKAAIIDLLWDKDLEARSGVAVLWTKMWRSAKFAGDEDGVPTAT